jgi:uncharacterized protein (TIGR03118 family)
MGAVANGQQYTQVNLVSNNSGKATTTDANLVNAWGISRGPTGNWWVSDYATGVATLYAGAGIKKALTVSISPNPNVKESKKTGCPTGIIFNNNAIPNHDFLLSNNLAAEFIFATIDGTIAAWNNTINLAPGALPPSTKAQTVVATKDGSVYTGLTSSVVNGQRFLYVANFALGRVDVYDNSFHRVRLDGGHPYFPGNASFTDLRIPSSFVPFNVQAVGNNIVVTYAMNKGGEPFAGPGLGYVDVYSSAGELLQRLDGGEQLNVPWGVALAPLDFGSASHELLIGQFGNAGDTKSAGSIAMYNPLTGHFDGMLKNAAGTPIIIEGLLGLTFGNSAAPQPGPYDPAGAPSAELFFAAGPNDEADGLFGYLTPVATDLLQGNDQ